MKLSGRCMVAIENKKGDFYQVSLDVNGMAFVLNAIEQYQGGKVEIIKEKLPLYLPKKVKNK